MNPVRSMAPDVVANDYAHYLVYLVGPLLGALLAVIAAFVLRGPGGGRAGSSAAQGNLFTEVADPNKT